MKTLVLTAALVLAFTVSSALAQSCPNGGCGGKKKDTSTNSTGTNSTAIVKVAL